MSTRELSADLLRRVLIATEFEYSGDLFWRCDEGVLSVFAKCSDFFAWGGADLEAIETERDVALLELCLNDLRAATTDTYPMWLTELYAARRRKQLPADFMMNGTHAMDAVYLPLFEDIEDSPQES